MQSTFGAVALAPHCEALERLAGSQGAIERTILLRQIEQAHTQTERALQEFKDAICFSS
jgi:hypothetical protein